MDSKRIDHLVTPGALEGKRIVVVGIGSGGFPSIQSLAMCGVSDWILFDKDELGPENLVKHPAMRRELGHKKTDIAKKWILDRNPNANVTAHDVDITSEEGEKILSSAIASATVVICCTDSEGTRQIVNDHCIEQSTPCVTGVIWRTGFGGDAFLYVPGKSACFRCLMKQATHVDPGRMLDDAKAASSIENPIQKVQYGREPDKKYGVSGLSIDIQFISLIQARLALAVLLDQRMNDSFYEVLRTDPILATSMENHMLQIPYDYRGESPPDSFNPASRPGDIGTIWYDTKNDQMKKAMYLCMNCKNPYLDESHYYCWKCGFFLETDDNEQVPETTFEKAESKSTKRAHAWVPMAKKEGYGVNYVSFANRRHIIDEKQINDDGYTEPTGNIHVAMKPFTVNTTFVPRLPDCEYCLEEDE